jgi:Cellulase (glycosyl hydrolase family 5)
MGGAAVVGALPNIVKSQTRRSVAIFQEEGFPRIQSVDVSLAGLSGSLPGLSVTFLSEQQLTRLDPREFELFINPYGSAFPKRAWNAILKYLQRGGNWLNLGGVPLSRPVVRTASGWRAEPYQASYHQRLSITHFFPVEVAKVVKYQIPHEELTRGFAANEIFELYVRLSSSSNEPDEAGSDGPHEGVVESLVFGLNREGRAIAAPIVQIDRYQAEFKGGRWVFANFSGPLTENVVRALVERAAQGAVRFRVRSEFASYRTGEVPSISVEGAKGDYSLEVRDPGGYVNRDLKQIAKPGFYEVRARAGDLTHTNGFWVYDEELLKRGKPLTVDNHFFYRDGKVFPVTGTTYMASDVHRRYLFEPNPAVWDRDFREMKQAGVNMIRTGIWTGWKKYMPEVGKVSEGVLRAFDAFLLTAHKYDIPVIFTFFAFLPETWGGVNAYLDPKAVKAQQQFISAFAERCRSIDDVIWDFINEPSFCSPKFLWNCRPNYDEFETAAWKQWLRDRYPAASDEERPDELIAQLQERWRTTRNDILELPTLQDFESVHLIDERAPLKTLDYRLFAQDMFMRWTRQMTTAVRSNGNPRQLITVGQDEAGLGDSPNIQFFAPLVDFTSLHNWWANDDLVWDSVLAKVPSKASLMEETGVMFYERAEGDAPWRSEQEVSNLLERKLALSFAADGAGFIEWIWNTNPYMNSTNEVGIGFHRVDGTAKPELEPFLAIAKFMREHGQRFQERQAEPVVMLIPHSHMFSPRSFAYEATRRCVRAMYYHCGVPLQAISEYTLASHGYPAKLIIVPAPRTLTPQCWDELRKRMEQGATVAVTGVLESDEQWLPVKQTESFSIDGRDYLVRFEGEKIQRIEKAEFTQIKQAARLIRCALPLELGDSMEALVAFYQFAMKAAGVAPIFTVSPKTPAVLVLPSVFRDVVLYTFVSETDRDTAMQVTDLQTQARFSVSVPAGRTAMVMLDRRNGKQLT